MSQYTLAKFVPTASDPWDRSKAAHVLNRAGFGGRPDEVDRIVRLRMDAAVDELIDSGRFPENFPVPDYSNVRALWESYARLIQERAPQRERFEAIVAAQRADNQKFVELREWWVTRMILSPRPLQEKMVLFWHGLLVSGRPEVRQSELLLIQNEMFRRNALGSFKDMTLAISKDPAMLRYLDNNINRRGRPNENYARELLELFTMGIGNYTEQDIKEAARAFTGWTYRNYEFYFDTRQHDDGSKTFLGRTGNLDGGDIINIIFEQPATARWVPRKLFEYFGYLRPEDSLVVVMADLFRRRNFEVAPLVRAILSSSAFYSPKAMRTQVKSPVQLVVGTARLLEPDAAAMPALIRAMDLMGQALFVPPNVGGWPRGEGWITTMTILHRYNFSSLILTGGMPGLARRPAARPAVPTGAQKILDGAGTAGEVVNRLVNAMAAGMLADERKSALMRALGASNGQTPYAREGAATDAKLRSALHLLMSSPEYQMA
ncbi:MAG: DUF1800 domain-containing protein [bacterium]